IFSNGNPVIFIAGNSHHSLLILFGSLQWKDGENSFFFFFFDFLFFKHFYHNKRQERIGLAHWIIAIIVRRGRGWRRDRNRGRRRRVLNGSLFRGRRCFYGSRSNRGYSIFYFTCKSKKCCNENNYNNVKKDEFYFFHFVLLSLLLSPVFSFLSINIYVLIVHNKVITSPLPLTSFLSPMEISEMLTIRGNLATLSKK